MAADEAVKATNTEIVSIELARDMKRWRRFWFPLSYLVAMMYLM